MAVQERRRRWAPMMLLLFIGMGVAFMLGISDFIFASNNVIQMQINGTKFYMNDTSGLEINGTVNITGLAYYNGSLICTANNSLCGAGAADGNNYPTNITVTNGSTHTITIGRNGLAALVATFDDQNSGGAGSGGNMSVWRLGADTGTNANITNNTLVRVLSGGAGITTSITGLDLFIQNTGVVTESDPIWTAASGNYFTITQVNAIVNSLRWRMITGTGSYNVQNNTGVGFLAGTGITLSNDTLGNLTIASSITQYTDALAAVAVQNSTILRNRTVANFSGLFVADTRVCLENGTFCQAPGGGNSSFNQTLTDTLYYPRNTNPQGFYNSTTFTNYYPLSTNPLGYLNTSAGDNTSWNQSYATTLFYPLATNPLGYLNTSVGDNTTFNQTLTDNLYYPRNTNPQTYYNSTTFTDYYPLLTNTLEYINRTTGIWLGNTSIIAGLVSSNSTVLRNNTYAVFSTVNATSGNFGNTNLTTTQIIEGINLYFTSTRAGDAVGNSTIIRNFSNVILNQVNITTANISQLNVGTTNLTTGQITETSNLYFTSTRAGDAVGNSSIIRNFSSVIFNRANITTANISQLNVGTTNLTTAQLTETSNLFFTSTRAGDAVGNASILRNFSNAIFNQVNITTANISRLNAATTNLTTTQIAEGTNRYWTSNLANITGSGLPNYMVKWHNATHLNTSVIQDYGNIVNISANLTVGVGTNNTANISVVGNNLVLQPVMYVGINTSTPTHTLTVRGNVNFTGLPAGSGSLYLCITAGGQVYTAVTNCVTG